MPTAAVEARTLTDATDGFAQIKGVHETNQERQLNLIITSDGDAHHLRVVCGPQLADAFKGVDLTRSYRLPITSAELWGVVQECRQAWHDYIVYRRGAHGQFVFQNNTGDESQWTGANWNPIPSLDAVMKVYLS